MSRQVVPVSTLVHYLKEAMEGDPVLHGVLVEGEVSNFKIPFNSNHWYFSLKDDTATLNCAMFATANRTVGFTPKNGDKIIVSGDVSVYEAHGSMQLIARTMQPSGLGSLYLKLEKLKNDLRKEGLFEDAHKKPLPKYPMDIALVTGKNTAAHEDVMGRLRSRWPIAAVHEYPCPVQGNDAPPKIIEALKKADAGHHDVILLVRGGGSLEDLWCFNDEGIVRAIYAAKTPVVTGIGHDIDHPLVDEVADGHANSPTGAVELVVPTIQAVNEQLRFAESSLITSVQTALDQYRVQLDHLKKSTVLTRPDRLYSEQAQTLNYLEERLMHYQEEPQRKRMKLDSLSQHFYACIQNKNKDLNAKVQEYRTQMVVSMRKEISMQNEQLHLQQNALQQNMQTGLQNEQHRLNMQIKLLDAYSPLKILDRGYSVVTKEDHVINQISDVQINDAISIRLTDGNVHAKVTNLEKKYGKDKNDI